MPNINYILDDFVGFQYNGYHSSELGIKRVSDGSRYTEELSPAFKDITAEKTGGDGTLYWESFYTQKPFNISIAFDNIDEVQLRKLKQVFNGKSQGELIFDELPFKAYRAKTSSPIQLKYICFTEEREKNGVKVATRVYKGEGNISFVCYEPYARSIDKFLNDYGYAEYLNKYEWAEASGMLEEQGSYDSPSSSTVLLYNAGDIETNLEFYLSNITGGKELQLSFDETAKMIIKVPTNTNITKIKFNSKTHLLEGYNGDTMITITNDWIDSGDFFKLPIGAHSVSVSEAESTEEITKIEDIKYDYLYY